MFITCLSLQKTKQFHFLNLYYKYYQQCSHMNSSINMQSYIFLIQHISDISQYYKISLYFTLDLLNSSEFLNHLYTYNTISFILLNFKYFNSDHYSLLIKFKII